MTRPEIHERPPVWMVPAIHDPTPKGFSMTPPRTPPRPTSERLLLAAGSLLAVMVVLVALHLVVSALNHLIGESATSGLITVAMVSWLVSLAWRWSR